LVGKGPGRKDFPLWFPRSPLVRGHLIRGERPKMGREPMWVGTRVNPAWWEHGGSPGGGEPQHPGEMVAPWDDWSSPRPQVLKWGNNAPRGVFSRKNFFPQTGAGAGRDRGTIRTRPETDFLSLLPFFLLPGSRLAGRDTNK